MPCFDYHFTDTPTDTHQKKQNDYRQAKVVGVEATSDFLPAFLLNFFVGSWQGA